MVVVLSIGLRAFFKKRFNCSNFATSWEGIELNRKIQVETLAKPWAPTFKNLPDKLLMPAALDELKPFKILNFLSGDVSKSWKFKSFYTGLFLWKDVTLDSIKILREGGSVDTKFVQDLKNNF